MKNIRMICSDIDGTLLDANRQLSLATIEALSVACKHLPVVLISSRMPRAMQHLQAELGAMDHPLIAYNGGLVLDLRSAVPETLLSIEIPITTVRSVIEFATNSSIHISLYHGDEWYVPRDDYWAQREANNTKVQPEILDGLTVCNKWSVEGKGAHKIMCMGDAEEIGGLYDRLQEAIGDEVHLYRSKDTYIEIASKKISKLSGLSHLIAARYDISLADVVAFGDNYNDVEMIRGVGYGVAVGNAREEVKSVANRIAGDAKLDGVADVVRELLQWAVLA